MRKHYQKIFAFFFAISSLVLILTGCSKKENSSNKISIVTSTNVYADIAQNVLGKYGKATAIITNSATDPHDFEPTTADAKKVQNAKNCDLIRKKKSSEYQQLRVFIKCQNTGIQCVIKNGIKNRLYFCILIIFPEKRTGNLL